MQVKDLIEAFKKNLITLNVFGGQATTCFKTLEVILKLYKPDTNLTPQIMQEIQGEYSKKLNELVENSKTKLVGSHWVNANVAILAEKKINQLAQQIVAVPIAAKAPSQQGQPSLLDIFAETKLVAEQFAHDVDRKLTAEMVEKTLAFRMRKSGDLLNLFTQAHIPTPSKQRQFPNGQTNYRILNADTLIAASQLKNPLVLNMANKISIGGGVENGTTAQEESLFRCTNLYQSLYPLGKPYKGPNVRHQGRMYYNYPISEFGGYYSPRVQVFRDATNQFKFIKPFEISCISVAGYDLGKPELYEDTLRDKNKTSLKGNELLKAFKEGTKIKIRFILETAILNGHENLVLGALSCGAFKLPNDNTGLTAEKVAEAYREVLEEPKFKGAFNDIIFAIYAPNNPKDINLTTFQRVLQPILTPPQDVKVAQDILLSASPLVFTPKALPASFAQQDQKELQEAQILFKKFEQMGFFDKLPPDTNIENTKKAIMQALKDLSDTGLNEWYLYIEDIGKNGDQIWNEFLNVLSRDILNEKGKNGPSKQ